MEKIPPTLKNTKRLILPLIIGFSIIALDSCIIIPRSGHHKKGYKKKGPPPWAPAHGKRGKKRGKKGFTSIPTIGSFNALSSSTYTFPDGHK
ncbi:MAG: hypothetical protein JJU02_14595 [Cryomorphaceae bacterium]|nr:hypothetical protein [Cryomorphaceae bacterium]